MPVRFRRYTSNAPCSAAVILVVAAIICQMCIATRGVVSVTRIVCSLARLYGVDEVWSFRLVADASVYVLVQSAASLSRIQITCRCTKLSSAHPGRSWFVSHIGWAVLLPSALSTSDVVQRRKDLD
jgi:hypothetical protein